jgi:hypothetical protein
LEEAFLIIEGDKYLLPQSFQWQIKSTIHILTPFYSF